FCIDFSSLERVPLATAVWFQLVPAYVNAQYTVLFVENCGSKTKPNKPPFARASTFGSPAIASLIFPAALTILILPSFSVINNLPSDNTAIPHGDFNLFVMTLKS